MRDENWHRRMVELADEHVRTETRGELEACLETIEEDCVYELHPMGVVVRGRDAMRKAYGNLQQVFQPSVIKTELRARWTADDHIGQEYRITLPDATGTVRTFSVVGLLMFGDELLSGERIYAHDDFHRLCYGPVVDECESSEP